MVRDCSEDKRQRSGSCFGGHPHYSPLVSLQLTEKAEKTENLKICNGVNGFPAFTMSSLEHFLGFGPSKKMLFLWCWKDTTCC